MSQPDARGLSACIPFSRQQWRILAHRLGKGSARANSQGVEKKMLPAQVYGRVSCIHTEQKCAIYGQPSTIAM